ncbi:PAK4-inhibitor INKA2 isoform X2 [Lissotriton helveticus]
MERRGMDVYLRRLKQELVSMKEVGDGLHEQMNCMMGALQELKLLQVQTALERMEISGGPSNQTSSGGQCQCSWEGHRAVSGSRECRPPQEPAPITERYSEERHSYFSSRSTNVFSTDSSMGSGHRHMFLPFRTTYSDRDPSETVSTSSTLPAMESWTPGTCQSVSSDFESIPHTGAFHPREVPAAYDRGSQEGSVCDDTEDWTSSLMSQSRNRQPLVLGDNIFADLVENWLDLPEVDKKGEMADPSLPISRSQEVCRKFSLTANIFKKFLRSVRPDKSKLLKEKPGWLPASDKGTDIPKRSKKISKQKGTFYFSFHNNMHNACSIAEKRTNKESSKEKARVCTKRVNPPTDHARNAFDFNTVVWV